MDTNYDEIFNADAPSRYEAAPVMATPAHPGDLMRDIIEEWKITITDAATWTGIQRTHLSAMLAGDKPVSIETAIKFEAALGGPAPTVLHSMSDQYESSKAMQKRDELVSGITRLTQEAVEALRSRNRKPRVSAAA